MARPTPKPKLKQRLANRVDQRVQQAAAASDNPRLLWVWLRSALLRMWRLRGGGFYGLGFVLTFVGLQLASLLEDAAEAQGPVDFLTSQMAEALIRLLGDTLSNLIQAFLWPFLFVGWTGPYGLLLLLGSFLAFDRWGKPWINAQFPAETEAAAQTNVADKDEVDATPPR